MNIAKTYDPETKVDFLQETISKGTLHLSIEDSEGSIEIYMSESDLAELIDKMNIALELYRKQNF